MKAKAVGEPQWRGSKAVTPTSEGDRASKGPRSDHTLIRDPQSLEQREHFYWCRYGGHRETNIETRKKRLRGEEGMTEVYVNVM